MVRRTICFLDIISARIHRHAEQIIVSRLQRLLLRADLPPLPHGLRGRCASTAPTRPRDVDLAGILARDLGRVECVCDDGVAAEAVDIEERARARCWSGDREL